MHLELNSTEANTVEAALTLLANKTTSTETKKTAQRLIKKLQGDRSLIGQCAACGEMITHTPGKRRRKYCNDTCRQWGHRNPYRVNAR